MNRGASIKPYKNKGDRITQLRQLLSNKVTQKQLAEWGFDHLEITAAKLSLQKRSERVRVDTGHKPKDLVRCKGCGGMASESTLQKGVCLGCVCRERTNFERKGRFRV